MNFKTIVLLLAAGQGLLLSLALISKSWKTNKSNFFLGIVVFVMSIEVLSDFARQLKYQASPNAFPFWFLGSYLFLPPAIWFFFRINLSVNFKITRRYVWLFLPAFIEICIESVSAVLLRFYGIRLNLVGYTGWFLFTEILPLAGMIAVILIYGFQLISAKRRAGQSGIPAVIKHVNIHTIVFGVLASLTVLWVVMVFSRMYVFGIVEVILVCSIYVLGYIAYVRPSFFMVPHVLQHASDDKKTFNGYNHRDELNRVNDLLISGKLYAKSKLSLNDLAQELRLPPRYVSFLINTYYNTNFSDFINGYRVKEVMKKIQDPAEQHKTLLGLAFEAGFNSKSAFNQAFKAHTGKTPSDFLSSKGN